MIGIRETMAETRENYFKGMPAPAISPEQMPAIYVTKFWTKYREDPNNPEKMVEEDWVAWVKKGDQTGAETREAIKRLAPNPKRGQPARIEWMIIEEPYKAWKAGEEMPVNGTPLAAWNGVSRELANELKKFHCYTIEDIADFPDHNVNKVPIPGFRDLIKKAKAWQEAKSTSDVGAALAQRDERISQQESEMAEMRKSMSEMQAQMAAMQRMQGNAAAVLSGEAPPVEATNPSDDDEYVDMKSLGDVSRAPAPRGKNKPRKDPI